MATVQPGDVLAGKYVVERFIAKGGTGFVVAAYHRVLNRRVAVKLLNDEVAAMPEVATRFLREAQTAARLTNPHATRIMDADRLETGRPYIVMEYLDGRDLRVVLKEQGPLAPGVAARYVAQAAEAIAEAHALGIVHRDIKPSNLFLTSDRTGRPLVKVLDFGISKLLPELGDPHEALDVITRSCQVIGSPHFMSPEQMRASRDVDGRTDIWSLGATLFVLLTGKFPFRGAGLVELSNEILVGPRPTLGPGAPPALEALVSRCLSVEASARYGSAAELGRELVRFAESIPAAEASQHVPSEPRASFPPASAPLVPERAADLGTRRPALAFVGRIPGRLAIGALIVTGGLVALRRPQHPARAASPSAVVSAVPSTPTGATAGAVQSRDDPTPDGSPSSDPMTRSSLAAARPGGAGATHAAKRVPPTTPIAPRGAPGSAPSTRPAPSSRPAVSVGVSPGVNDFDVIHDLPH